MKRFAIVFFCVVLFPFFAYGAPAQDGGATFRQVEGQEWILSEVKTADITIPMDRQKLEADGLGEVYTIGFQEGRVSGMGAPNRYFGPYTSGGNRYLSLGELASTMMFAFREPDGLSESQYFSYLSGVTRWDIRGGNLELYSSNGTVLVYSRK